MEFTIRSYYNVGDVVEKGKYIGGVVKDVKLVHNEEGECAIKYHIMFEGGYECWAKEVELIRGR